MIMNSFLNHLAKNILEKHSDQDLKDVTVVIPSRRASVHFKKELASLQKKTSWSPKIKTLDSFLEELYDKEIVEQTHSIVLLYRSYCKANDNPEDFNHFLNWGDQILSDFNEIDRYLLDYKSVFKNLKDIKEIESWSFNTKELSTMQNQFLQFWENLGFIYNDFHEELNKLNLSTKSKMYRDIAENFELYFKELQTPIYFAGFNALSTSEELIFKQLKSTGKAEIFWDIDPYYILNEEQEAGYFIRKYNWDENIKKTQKKIGASKINITLYPANNTVNQLKIAGNILEQNPQYFSTKTALVLADENLLEPLLFTLPDLNKNVNITMGLPLRQTAAGDLVKTIFKIILNNLRQGSKNVIYYKDFFSLIDNSLLNKYFAGHNIDKKKIQSGIRKNNLAYISGQYIQNQTNEAISELKDLLNTDKKGLVLLNTIQNLLEKIRLFLVENNFSKQESEALYLIQNLIHLLTLQTEKYPELNSIETLEKLLLRKLSSEKLSFFGEPLQGLQIMGLLETRAIDFDHLIIVSSNEKFLPGNKHPNTIIPTDLRSYLGLPNKYEREAIFSYYIYRLLHQVKDIHFIYNNDVSDQLNSNEISRYLLQINNELKEFVNTKEFVFEHFEKTKTGIIQKTDVFNKIDSFLESGISPSALNTYIGCPKDFFYKYLLRISEDDNVEESMESSTKGDIIHEVLEDLFRLATNNNFPATIDFKQIEFMLENFKEITEKAFQKKYQQDSYKIGKNYLQYKMALKSIERLLLNEKFQIKKTGPFEVLGVEKSYETNLSVNTNNGVKNILLKGKFDRIDKVNGEIRVIDYKSGKVEKKDVKLGDDIMRNPKALQLLFYKYLYFKTHQILPSAGIFSLINLNEGLIEYESNSEQNDIERFEGLISEIVNELYNIEIPFTHKPDSLYCMLCEN